MAWWSNNARCLGSCVNMSGRTNSCGLIMRLWRIWARYSPKISWTVAWSLGLNCLASLSLLSPTLGDVLEGFDGRPQPSIAVGVLLLVVEQLRVYLAFSADVVLQTRVDGLAELLDGVEASAAQIQELLCG